MPVETVPPIPPIPSDPHRSLTPVGEDAAAIASRLRGIPYNQERVLGELHHGPQQGGDLRGAALGELQPGDIGEVDDGKITSPVDRIGDRPPTVTVPTAWPPICK